MLLSRYIFLILSVAFNCYQSMTKRFNKQSSHNPMELAFLSMSTRVNRMIDVLSDPYVSLTTEKRDQVMNAITAIEEEWLIPGVNSEPD